MIEKPRTCFTFKQCRFRPFRFVLFFFLLLFFSSQYFANCCLFYYIGMPRKNWMISDLILPPEKVSRMFPSIKSDCLKYLQQCLIRINSYSQSSLSKKKKKELGLCDLTSTCMVSLLGGTSMWLSVHLQTNWNWLRTSFYFVRQHLIWSPSCGLLLIRCSSNSLPSTALTYCCYYRGVHLCFLTGQSFPFTRYTRGCRIRAGICRFNKWTRFSSR